MLDQLLKAELQDKDYKQTVTPENAWGQLRQHLAEIGWPSDRYPYTHLTSAKESLRRYLGRRRDALIQSRTRPARPVTPRPNAVSPLACIQIDAQTVDLHTTAYLEIDGILSPVRLSRATVIAARDEATGCWLGYVLVLAKEPNQYDLLRLLDLVFNPTRPETEKRRPAESPPLHTAPGARFPIEDPALRHTLPLMIKLDNALINHADRVAEFVCEAGCVLSLGRPARPLDRRVVENGFNLLNLRASHRFASTTGSHVVDPKRESRKNAKRQPKITLNTFDRVVRATLTDDNTRPRPQLGARSPLEALQLRQEQAYARVVAPLFRQFWPALGGRKVVTVKHTRDKHPRRHINFERLPYRGQGLANVPPGEKKIRITWDEQDIRQVEAFRLTGEPLGTLRAPRTWRHFPHSRSTRKLVFKLVAERQVDRQDPLAGTFRHLLKERHLPTVATDVIRIFKEFTHQSSGDGVAVPEEDTRAPTSSSARKWQLSNAFTVRRKP